MSFLKKLTKEFEGLTSAFGDKDKTKDANTQQQHGGYPGQQSGGYLQQQGGYSGQQSSGYPPQQYGQQPPQQYGQQQQSGYPPQTQGYPPQHNQYGAPPSGPPLGQAQLPLGWVQRWDQNSQRNYYLNESNGHTQWEPPAFSPPPQHAPYGAPSGPPPGQPGYDASRGQGPPGASSGFYQGYGGAMPQGGYGSHGEMQHQQNAAQYYGNAAVNEKDTKKDKKGGGMGKVLLAGGAGLAAGGLIGHALGDSDSDDEKKHSAAAYGAPSHDPGYGGYGAAGAGAGAYGAGGYPQNGGYPPPGDQGEGVYVPTKTADGDSVSSSDQEDIIEAHEELQEAREDGDRSDIEEAQEELDEAYEEAYDD